MEQQEFLAQTLKEKAELVQTTVMDVGSLDQAFGYAAVVTTRQGGTTVAAEGLDAHSRSILAEVCRKSGLTLLEGDLRKAMDRIHTAVTMPDWGIAETATLVQASDSEDLRIATMLSEVHVAVLPRSRIVASALDLEEELGRRLRTPGGYLAFISGASRTADIERVLTIGVHGPRELHLLLLDEKAS
jgi:L-lactate dehydrogenase complex protein LldG